MSPGGIAVISKPTRKLRARPLKMHLVFASNRDLNFASCRCLITVAGSGSSSNTGAHGGDGAAGLRLPGLASLHHSSTHSQSAIMSIIHD